MRTAPRRADRRPQQLGSVDVDGQDGDGRAQHEQPLDAADHGGRPRLVTVLHRGRGGNRREDVRRHRGRRRSHRHRGRRRAHRHRTGLGFRLARGSVVGHGDEHRARRRRRRRPAAQRSRARTPRPRHTRARGARPAPTPVRDPARAGHRRSRSRAPRAAPPPRRRSPAGSTAPASAPARAASGARSPPSAEPVQRVLGGERRRHRRAQRRGVVGERGRERPPPASGAALQQGEQPALRERVGVRPAPRAAASATGRGRPGTRLGRGMRGEYQSSGGRRASAMTARDGRSPLLDIAEARASACWRPRRRSPTEASPSPTRSAGCWPRTCIAAHRRAGLRQLAPWTASPSGRARPGATCASSASRAPGARRTSARRRRRGHPDLHRRDGAGRAPTRWCRSSTSRSATARVTLRDDGRAGHARARRRRGPARRRRRCSPPGRALGPAELGVRRRRRAREVLCARARASPCSPPATSSSRPAPRSAPARSTTPTASRSAHSAAAAGARGRAVAPRLPTTGRATRGGDRRGAGRGRRGDPLGRRVRRAARPRQARAARARRGGALLAAWRSSPASRPGSARAAERWSSGCRATRCRRWSTFILFARPALRALQGAAPPPDAGGRAARRDGAPQPRPRARACACACAPDGQRRSARPGRRRSHLPALHGAAPTRSRSIPRVRASAARPAPRSS